MKIIFMGTPDFAVETLKAVYEAGHEIVLVVTQPDRPKGRGGAIAMSAVKQWAMEKGLPIFQPEKIKAPESVDYLRQYPADIAVVAAFGQILPKVVLNMPRHGCINVHASLLPKYRGAAPIQWAILNGDEYTGITIMKMDVGLDDGDIITQSRIAIEPDDTGGSLFDKLALEGGRLAVSTLSDIEENRATFTPQDDEQATKVGMIGKELGKLDFGRSAAELERYIRGLSPWPGTYTVAKGKTIKIHKAFVLDGNGSAGLAGEAPGTVLLGDAGYEDLLPAKDKKKVIPVKTGSGILAITELQLEGKKRLSAEEFLRGHRVEKGTVWGK